MDDAKAIHTQMGKLSLDKNTGKQAAPAMKKKRPRKPKRDKLVEYGQKQEQQQPKDTTTSQQTGRFSKDPHSAFPVAPGQFQPPSPPTAPRSHMIPTGPRLQNVPTGLRAQKIPTGPRSHHVPSAPSSHNAPKPPKSDDIPETSRTTQRLPSDFFQSSSPSILAEIPSFVPTQQQGAQPTRRSTRLTGTPQAQPGFFKDLYKDPLPAVQDPEVRSPKPHDIAAKALSHKVLRPTPSQEYIARCQKSPIRLDHPRKLLVVLDLNGVLVFRKRGLGYRPRPDLVPFLDYLFANHSVMIWSSGMPTNVGKIVERLMSPEQCAQLVAIWARDTLRLPAHLYGEKVQVYKQLSWIWEDGTFKAGAAGTGTETWDQSNTVLIDDTREKAIAEPSNLICVDEFINTPEQQKKQTLLDVVAYLEQVRWFADVSCAMRELPFVLSSP